MKRMAAICTPHARREHFHPGGMSAISPGSRSAPGETRHPHASSDPSGIAASIRSAHSFVTAHRPQVVAAAHGQCPNRNAVCIGHESTPTPSNPETPCADRRKVFGTRRVPSQWVGIRVDVPFARVHPTSSCQQSSLRSSSVVGQALPYLTSRRFLCVSAPLREAQGLESRFARRRMPGVM